MLNKLDYSLSIFIACLRYWFSFLLSLVIINAINTYEEDDITMDINSVVIFNGLCIIHSIFMPRTLPHS